MKRLVVLLSLLLVTTSATADDPKKPQPILKVAPAAVKVVTKAPPIKTVPAAKAAGVPTKVVTKAPPIKATPTSQPVAATPAVKATSQPASAPASQKLDMPKDTAGAISSGQQFIRDLQHKDWRHAAAVLLMLLIFVWRRYGEKFLALHKVPDRYLGFVTAGVAVLYALGLALGTKGAFDWSTFISNAIVSGGESMLAWELGGKFLLEKTLGPTPAKLRQRAVRAAGVTALKAVADDAVKIEDDKPTAKDDKSA